MAERRVELDGLHGRLVVSVAEFAQVLGLGRRTVQRAISGGLIRSFRIGRRRLIPVAEVENILAGADRRK